MRVLTTRTLREEKVLQAFADLWGTDELICSFDAM